MYSDLLLYNGGTCRRGTCKCSNIYDTNKYVLYTNILSKKYI